MKEFVFWGGAVGAYAVAAVWVTYNHLRGIRPSVLSWWLVLAGWLTQWVPLVRLFVAEHGALAVNLGASLELSALTMGGLYLLWWRIHRQEARTVGVLLLPLMVFALTGSRLLPVTHPDLRVMTDPLLLSHLVLSLLAYGLFSIAAILALMDAFQEHALRTKHLGDLFASLPPLDALEETLFLMVTMGFALLTASMLTGGWYAYAERGTALAFNHKQVFTWATWLVFGTLLLGRHFQGWRGRRAVRFTLWGYLFLALAFFGVKFVSEVVLGR
ncbi:MAG: cytochrome c biogenesis protein CcsA [Magnetococcus sp. DMHC-8]